MAAHGVSFVRTGVWMSNDHFIEAATGGANERFLRNLEAFLDCARRHQIAVNFTFFAFAPHSGPVAQDAAAIPANPYTDAGSVNAGTGLCPVGCGAIQGCALALVGPDQRAQLLQPEADFSRQCSQRRPIGDRSVA